MANPIRRETGNVEVTSQTDAFFESTDKIYPPGTILYYIDGPNAGKNKISNGIDAPTDLPFIEDLGGGDVGDLATDVAALAIDMANLLDERAKNRVWVFSTNTTTNEDPGSGVIRFNSASIGDVAEISIDAADQAGADQKDWIDRWSGLLVFQEIYYRNNDGTWVTSANTLVFRVTAVSAQTGYRKLSVQYVQGSLPTANAILEVIQVGQNGGLYSAEYDGSSETINSAINEGGYPGPGPGDSPTWNRNGPGDYVLRVYEVLDPTSIDVGITVCGTTPLMHAVNASAGGGTTDFNFLLADADGVPTDTVIKVTLRRFT